MHRPVTEERPGPDRRRRGPTPKVRSGKSKRPARRCAERGTSEKGRSNADRILKEEMGKLPPQVREIAEKLEGARGILRDISEDRRGARRGGARATAEDARG